MRPKTSSYLAYHGSVYKKRNRYKNNTIKPQIKFEDSKNCLQAKQLQNKVNYLEGKNWSRQLKLKFLNGSRSTLKQHQNAANNKSNKASTP